MTIFLAVGGVLVAALASPAVARSQDQGTCPLHQAHARRSEVDRRHEAATGLASDGIEHHFLLTREGGTIRLEVKDETQIDARDRVRAHLRTIARAFAAGDFSMPARIHEQAPPGAETMKARKDLIRYAYSDTPRGGTVTITSDDPDAMGAIHEFLRFQIEDHGTGDPVH